MHSSLTKLVHLGRRQCVRCISSIVFTCEVQLRQSPSSKTCSCFRSLKKWYSLSRSAHSEVKDCNMGSKLCPMRWQQTPKAQTFLKQVNMEIVSCTPLPSHRKKKEKRKRRSQKRKKYVSNLTFYGQSTSTVISRQKKIGSSDWTSIPC